MLPDALRHGTPQGLADALAAVSAADTRFRLPEIRCPALLVYGSRDAVTPLRMGQYLARHLPDARLEVLPQTAHAPFLSHADETAKLLVAFAENTRAA